MKLKENRFYRDENLTPENIIELFSAAGWKETRDWLGRDDDLTLVRGDSRISFDIQPNHGYAFTYYKDFTTNEYSSDYMMYCGHNLKDLENDCKDIETLQPEDFLKYERKKWFDISGNELPLLKEDRNQSIYFDKLADLVFDILEPRSGEGGDYEQLYNRAKRAYQSHKKIHLNNYEKMILGDCANNYCSDEDLETINFFIGGKIRYFRKDDGKVYYNDGEGYETLVESYFGNDKKEIVDYLIESPYVNWYEEHRDYLMSLDSDKLWELESEAMDKESEERSLYENKKVTLEFSDNDEAEEFADEMKSRYRFPSKSSRFQVVHGVGKRGKSVYIAEKKKLKEALSINELCKLATENGFEGCRARNNSRLDLSKGNRVIEINFDETTHVPILVKVWVGDKKIFEGPLGSRLTKENFLDLFKKVGRLQLHESYEEYDPSDIETIVRSLLKFKDFEGIYNEYELLEAMNERLGEFGIYLENEKYADDYDVQGMPLGEYSQHIKYGTTQSNGLLTAAIDVETLVEDLENDYESDWNEFLKELIVTLTHEYTHRYQLNKNPNSENNYNNEYEYLMDDGEMAARAFAGIKELIDLGYEPKDLLKKVSEKSLEWTFDTNQLYPYSQYLEKVEDVKDLRNLKKLKKYLYQAIKKEL